MKGLGYDKWLNRNSVVTEIDIERPTIPEYDPMPTEPGVREPSLDEDGDQIVDGDGNPVMVNVSAADLRTRREMYNRECEVREQSFKEASNIFNLRSKEYDRLQKERKKDLLERANTVVYLRDSISLSLRGDYASYDDPIQLYEKMSQDHSTEHRTDKNEVANKYHSFGMEAGEDMQKYLGRFRVIKSECAGAGLAIHEDEKDQIDKLRNGLDHRYLAAAQILAIVPVVTIPKMEQTLLCLEDTTKVVGQRNANSPSSTAKNSEANKALAFFANGANFKKLKFVMDQSSKKGESPNRSSGKGNHGGNGKPKDKGKRPADTKDDDGNCKYCQEKHNGECVKCFKCGGRGHKANDCPTKGKGKGSGDKEPKVPDQSHMAITDPPTLSWKHQRYRDQDRTDSEESDDGLHQT